MQLFKYRGFLLLSVLGISALYSKAALSNPVSAEFLATKLKEQKSSFASQVLDSPLYSVWIQKPVNDAKGDSCITDIAKFKVAERKIETAITVLPPTEGLEEARDAAIKKHALELVVSNVQPAMLKQTMQIQKKGSPEELNEQTLNYLLNRSDLPEKIIDLEKFEVKQWQKYELAKSGGIKNDSWITWEVKYKLLEVRENQISARRNARTALEIKRLDDEYEVLSKTAEAWGNEERRKLLAENQRLTAEAVAKSIDYANFPYIQLHFLHKIEAWDQPIVPMNGDSIAANYMDELKTIVTRVGAQCPNTQYIVTNHSFADFYGSERPIGQIMFKKSGATWQQVPLNYEIARYRFEPQYLTKNRFAGQESSFLWDRSLFHSYFSPYEVSLMQGESEVITVPAKYAAPTGDGIRLAALREHKEAGATVNFGAGMVTTPYFGGEITGFLKGVENVQCKPLVEGYRCSFVAKARTVFSDKGLAQVVGEIAKLLAGSNKLDSEAAFTYDFVLTSKGWMSADIKANIEEQTQKAREAVARGFGAGACAVTFFGPDDLVPDKCK